VKFRHWHHRAVAKKRTRRAWTWARLALAVLALGMVAFVAFRLVTTSTSGVDDRRRDERLKVTRALASQTSNWLGPWLAAGNDELNALAAGSADARGAVDRLISGPHVFTTEAVVVSDGGGQLIQRAGSARAFDQRPFPSNCPEATALLQQAGSGSGVFKVVPFPVAKPSGGTDCVPRVVAAKRAGGAVAVVASPVPDASSHLEATQKLGPGVRAFLIDPASNSAGSSPPGIRSSFRPNDGEDVRYYDELGRDARVLGATAEVVGGWRLFVVQDAGQFALKPGEKPANRAGLVVVAAFIVLIAVVVFFDIRRRRALRRADADRAAFLAIVGHELRTPLTVLKGFIDTLSARWDNISDEQRHSVVDRLPPQVRRLNRAVDRLLLAADLQAGLHPRPSSEPVDVRAALEGVAAAFRPIAPLHTIDVHADDGVVAVADRKSFGQVLDQVVDNAVKYSPSGGPVTLTARRRRGKVTITVEDEGVGLPSDTDRIFEPFTQGEEVDRRTHDEGGVGVGLFIVRTLVESMGGSVHADRRSPEPGTRLVVTLPAGATTGGDPPTRPARVHGPV
jgi:signal transduction histidine kinase